MKIVNRDISLKTVNNSGIWLELLSLAFVFLTLAVAVYSIEQAVWVSPQPSLLLTLLLALLTTFGLTRSRLPSGIKHGSVLLLGIAVSIWQLSSLLAPQPLLKALEAKPNENTTYFTVFLILGTWVVGYIATWFMLQRRNVWVTVFVGAGIVMVNLNNLPAKEYYRFFPFFTLSAVLLIGQANMAKNLRRLSQYGQGYSSRSALYYASVVVLISAFLASSAQFLPEIKTNPNLAISSKISWNNSENQWLNIFAAVPGKRGTINPVYIAKQSELFFSDVPYQEDTVHFMVTSNKADYLRTNRYDSYLSWGWSGTSTVDNVLYPEKESLASEFLHREELTYTVTNKLKTDLLLVAGELKTASLPVLLQTHAFQAIPAQTDGAVRDIISVTTPYDMPPEESYKVTVWLSQATPGELAQAGMDYDQWVTDHYLQLPHSLPVRVRELSQEIAGDAKTPYEKAIKIENFLQRFTYNTVFNTPPRDVDAVDYFLFEKKAGDCTYFASAMAVMLRSVGVPARISSGYRLGEKDKSTGQFILRARDYHARVEVFFPGYGWIEFEATPGLPGLSHEEYVGSIGLETTANVTRSTTQNMTQNMTQNASQKIDLRWVTYDEDGHLLDEFGNPIYDAPINMTAPQPSPNITPPLSPNTTSPLSQNATSSLSRNATTPLAPNATSPLSPGTIPASSPNATPAQSRGENASTLRNVFEKMAPSYPAVLPVMGVISLILFILGVAGIFLYQRWLNHIRLTGDPSRVYVVMCALAAMSQSGPRPIETPLEYGFRLALAIPAQSQIIDSITRIYAESRFSVQKEVDQTKMAELEKSWFQLYPSLVKRILRR